MHQNESEPSMDYNNSMAASIPRSKSSDASQLASMSGRNQTVSSRREQERLDGGRLGEAKAKLLADEMEHAMKIDYLKQERELIKKALNRSKSNRESQSHNNGINSQRFDYLQNNLVKMTEAGGTNRTSQRQETPASAAEETMNSQAGRQSNDNRSHQTSQYEVAMDAQEQMKEAMLNGMSQRSLQHLQMDDSGGQGLKEQLMSAYFGPGAQTGTQRFEGQLSQALTFNKQPPSVDGVSAGMNGTDQTQQTLRNNAAQCHSFGGSSRQHKQSQEDYPANNYVDNNFIQILDASAETSQERANQEHHLKMLQINALEGDGQHQQPSEIMENGGYMRPATPSQYIQQLSSGHQGDPLLPPLPPPNGQFSNVNDLNEQMPNSIFVYNEHQPVVQNFREQFGDVSQIQKDNQSFEQSFDKSGQMPYSKLGDFGQKALDQSQTSTIYNTSSHTASKMLAPKPPMAPSFINYSRPERPGQADTSIYSYIESNASQQPNSFGDYPLQVTHQASGNSNGHFVPQHDDQHLQELYQQQCLPQHHQHDDADDVDESRYEQLQGLLYDKQNAANEVGCTKTDLTSPTISSPGMLQQQMQQVQSYDQFGELGKEFENKHYLVPVIERSMEKSVNTSDARNSNSFYANRDDMGGLNLPQQQSQYEHERQGHSPERFNQVYGDLLQHDKAIIDQRMEIAQRRGLSRDLHGSRNDTDKKSERSTSGRYVDQQARSSYERFHDEKSPQINSLLMGNISKLNGHLDPRDHAGQVNHDTNKSNIINFDEPELVATYLQETNQILQHLSKNYKNLPLQVQQALSKNMEMGNTEQFNSSNFTKSRSKDILNSIKRNYGEVSSPLKFELNLNHIEKSQFVYLPAFFTNDAKQLESLNQMMSKINSIQWSFLEQGFIEKDQENWISFNAYQQTTQNGLNLVDLIYDISVQHNWLAENVIQLAKDLQDGALASTRKSLGLSSKQEEQHQIQALREGNQLLMSELEMIKHQLYAKEEQIKSINSQSWKTRIGQAPFTSQDSKTQQEYESLLKQKDEKLSKLHIDQQQMSTNFSKLNSDVEYYKQLSITLENQIQGSDSILKEAIQKLENIENQKADLKQQVIQLYEFQNRNLAHMKQGEPIEISENILTLEKSISEESSFQNVLQSFQDVIHQSNRQYSLLQQEVGGSKVVDHEKEEKLERQIQTLKQVIALQESLNHDKASSAQRTPQPRSYRESVDNMNLTTQYDGHTQTEAPKQVHASTQCSELSQKIYKDSHVQHNADDFSANNAKAGPGQTTSRSKHCSDQSKRSTKPGPQEELKPEQLLQEIEEQNFLIEQMKAIVKKAHRYEQFYQAQKAKKYRNCGIQALSECYVEMSERDQSQKGQDNSKLVQENEMYLRKNEAYFQLIEVLQGELQEKSQIVEKVKSCAICCLDSIQSFQESCILKNYEKEGVAQETKSLKEELAVRFQAHKSSTVQDIMKFVSSEIESLTQYWVTQMQNAYKINKTKQVENPGEVDKKKKKYKFRWSTHSPPQEPRSGTKQEQNEVADGLSEHKIDRIPSKYIKTSKDKSDQSMKQNGTIPKIQIKKTTKPFDPIDIQKAINMVNRGTKIKVSGVSAMTPTYQKQSFQNAFTPRSNSISKLKKVPKQQENLEDQRISKLKQKMINQNDAASAGKAGNALLQQQIQASYAMLQQNMLQVPESHKSMNIQNTSKVSSSKIDEAQADFLMKYGDSKLTDDNLDSSLNPTCQQDKSFKKQHQSFTYSGGGPSYLQPSSGLQGASIKSGENTSRIEQTPNSQLTYTNSEKSFNYIEEYLSLKSQRNKKR